MTELELLSRATQLRLQLGMDANSPVDVFALARGLDGLTLVFYPMGERISGMCVKAPARRCLIAINSTMSLGRQRFSLAHEFFHQYYDPNLTAICAKTISDRWGKEIEQQADFFASHFLMPQAALDMLVQKLSARHPNGLLDLEDIVRLEQHFGLSHRATMLRLKKTVHFPASLFEEYYNETGIRQIAERLGLYGELYLPTPESRRYGCYGEYVNMARQLFDAGKISNGKYEELLMDGFRSDLVYGEEGNDACELD